MMKLLSKAIFILCFFNCFCFGGIVVPFSNSYIDFGFIDSSNVDDECLFLFQMNYESMRNKKISSLKCDDTACNIVFALDDGNCVAKAKVFNSSFTHNQTYFLKRYAFMKDFSEFVLYQDEYNTFEYPLNYYDIGDLFNVNTDYSDFDYKIIYDFGSFSLYEICDLQDGSNIFCRLFFGSLSVDNVSKTINLKDSINKKCYGFTCSTNLKEIYFKLEKIKEKSLTLDIVNVSQTSSKNIMIYDISYMANINKTPFDKLFPLSFDLKKQLYELPAQQRKDFFCRAKFGGSVSYANNTRIMPFYSNLRLIKSNNTALIDLDRRTNYFSFFKGKKGLAFFASSAGFVAIKKFFELFTSGDDTYTIRPVRDLNQVCEFDCVDEFGNIQTATIPYYYDLETKSIFNEALAVCSNATMRYYDFVYDSLDEAVSISLRKDEIALLEAEQEKITQEYFLMQNKEYYNELLKEYYDPSLDEIYSLWADTHILEQARTTYQSKVFEKEKNDLLDMLNKGGFSETSIDYYKKFLDDETINKYRQAKLEADRRLDELLNGKDSGFKADENANSNTAVGVPPIDNNLIDDKKPLPPPPLPPTNEKDGGFKGDTSFGKGGVVGGGVGTGSGVGSIVSGGIVGGNVGSNANANTAEKDLTKDNAQDNAKEDTKENSKADDITISKDSTTAVEKTQTGSKVDVNVKTDVNVDVKANVTAKVEADDTLDKEYSKDINDFFNQFDKNPFDLDLSAFTKMYENFMNSKDSFLDKVKNYQMPLVSKREYDTCLFEKDVDWGFGVFPFKFDLCYWFSFIKNELYFIFYIFFSYCFIVVIYKFLIRFSRS